MFVKRELQNDYGDFAFLRTLTFYLRIDFMSTLDLYALIRAYFYCLKWVYFLSPLEEGINSNKCSATSLFGPLLPCSDLQIPVDIISSDL